MNVSNGYVQKKEIPIAIPIAMAAGSAFSSIFGASQSAKAAEEQQRQLAAERARIEAERTRKKYETWTATASGQNTLRMLRDEARRAFKRTSGAAAVGGATDAAVALEKEQQNLKQAEIIAQANANYEDKKDAVDATYRQELSGLRQQEIGIAGAKRQAIAGAASGVSNALMQTAGALFGGGGKTLTGTSNSSVPSFNQNYKVLNPYIYSYLSGSGYA